jgi:uncharacterized protein (DUF2384 family)
MSAPAVGDLNTNVTLPDARHTAVALKVIFRIFAAWGLSGEEASALLDCPRTTYFRWRRDPSRARLTRDQVYRLSYLFGIYRALQNLLPRSEAADHWVKGPNDAPLFGGRAPIDYMLSGNLTQLARVRDYLQASCGWS